MEALQLRSIGTEAAREPTGERSKSYLARIKSVLSQIPTTPSVISVPSSSSTESTESSSTIAPTITATESTEPSTATNSVLSLPEVFVVQKLYVSPKMEIDEQLQRIWTDKIRSRLSAELLRSIPTGTCVQEFMGVGSKSNNLKPAVVVCCGNMVTKKSVKKVFKTQGWLQELLRANGIIFVALVAKASLSAGPAIDPSKAIKLGDACSVKLPFGPVATSCGASLFVQASQAGSEQHCTLGGLLWVDGEIFGLTAGHPFENDSNPKRDNYTPGVNSDLDLLQDDSGDESEDPFVFNDDGGSPIEGLSRTSTLAPSSEELSSASIDNSSAHLDGTPNVLLPSDNWSLPFHAIVPLYNAIEEFSSEKPTEHQDWALLKDLPQSIAALPNKISHVDTRHDVLLEGIASGPAHGEVIITVAGIGAQLGHLHNAAASMNVNGYTLGVQLITLENSLPLGSSGAWVILDRKLCGFIVAIRQDVPWAYMTPIEPILNDIKIKLGAVDVRLPKRGETESLAKSSTTSKMTSAVQMTVEEDSSDDVYQDISIFNSSHPQGSADTPLMPNERSSTTSKQNEDATLPDLLSDFTEVERPALDPSRTVTSLFMPQGSSNGTSTCVSLSTGSNVSTAGILSRNYSDLDPSSGSQSRKTWMPWASKSQNRNMRRNGWYSLVARKETQRPHWQNTENINLHSEHWRNTEKPLPFKNNSGRRLRHILNIIMDLSLRWLMTATLCFMYISLVLTLEKRGALNSITRKSFNAVTTGISIALGLDIASALKDMASIMRWYVLTNRTYNLVELDLILGADNLRNLFKIALKTVKERPIAAVVILLWCSANLFAPLAIATLSYTHDFVPGSVTGVLQSGNITIPVLDHFYPLGQGRRTPTFQDEQYAAHLYGEYAQAWDLNSTGIFPKVGEIYQQSHPALWVDMKSSRIDLIFSDILTDPLSDASSSTYTDRKINITWACDSYKVAAGGNGTTQNIEVEGLGKIVVPRTPPNSLAYFTGNTDDTYHNTTDKCKSAARCSVVQAFETSGTDPWYYSCELTFGDTFSDLLNVSYISDQMAQIATNAIAAGPGFPTAYEQPAQIYSQPSPWGIPQKGNQTGIGLTIATFALGSIAAASIYNPSTTYEGMVPANGLYLQFSHSLLYLSFGLICGCRLLLCIVVAIFADKPVIGSKGHLSMSMLLRPITRGLYDAYYHGLDENDKAWQRLKLGTSATYAMDPITGKWGFRDRNIQPWSTEFEPQFGALP